MTHGGCSANTNGEQHTCTVPKVMTISNVWIHQQTSKEECNYMSSIPHSWGADDGGRYTFSDNQITVAGGCRAVFTVCYEGNITIAGYVIHVLRI